MDKLELAVRTLSLALPPVFLPAVLISFMPLPLQKLHSQLEGAELSAERERRLAASESSRLERELESANGRVAAAETALAAAERQAVGLRKQLRAKHGASGVEPTTRAIMVARSARKASKHAPIDFTHKPGHAL